MKKVDSGSPSKKTAKKPALPTNSPVIQVRGIKSITQLLLCVRAGGRCEFDGCNKYLFTHHLTHAPGNFAQMAHIVAFKRDGPRGNTNARPADINDIANLMLLCPECHHLIDTQAADYPHEVLEKYKQQHEKRILRLTGVKPDHQTTVVQLKALIGGQAIAIPVADIHQAVAPRYPEDPRGCVIDLTNIAGDDQAFYQAATRTIRQEMNRLYAQGMEVEKTRHISLFALAPIPLLIYLGSCLSNKVPVDLFQRHRDTEDWIWKRGGKSVGYKFRTLRAGTDKARVALVLSLSGKIHLADLPPEIDARFSVYEITLARGTPNPTYLRLKKDLIGFRNTYQHVMSELRAKHGQFEEIHLFPAIPAPIAVLCGREPLTKITPALQVYDNDRSQGGFKYILGVNHYDR